MKKLFINLFVAGFVAAGLGAAPAMAAEKVLPTPVEAIASYDEKVVAYETALAAYTDGGSQKGAFKAVRVAYKAVVKAHILAKKSINVAFKKGVKAAKVARKAAVQAATTVEEKKAARAAYTSTIQGLIADREAQETDLGSLPAVPEKKAKNS